MAREGGRRTTVALGGCLTARPDRGCVVVMAGGVGRMKELNEEPTRLDRLVG
jgi:hypothetical protein